MYFTEKEIKLKNNTKCILRSPNEQDAEAMISYLYQASEETHFMARYGKEFHISPEEEGNMLRKIAEDDRQIMIAAFVEGALAGNIGIHPVSPYIKMKHRTSLGIAVLKKYWQLGIGSALMTEGLDMAEKMGFSQIELGVYSDNLKAQSLYKKFDFQKWGTIQNAYRLEDGTYYDEILMGKIF